MSIRKKVIILVVAAGLSFVGLQQVSARGYGGGNGCGYSANCPNAGYGQNYQQMDEATRSKVDAFRADTIELRKQMAMKRAEKRALMSAVNPDPAAVAKVEGELFDLRTEMHSKATEAGVPMMKGAGGMRGWGGKGGYGGRMAPCSNQAVLN